MRKLLVAASVAGAWLLGAGSASADVQLSIADGRVSIVARDATVRQILAEWARVGQTRIVNLERIPGGPLTLELHDVPEARALDILLRSVSGFMAAPRTEPIAHASQFDRIIVMPTSTAPPAAPTRGAVPTPAFQPGSQIFPAVPPPMQAPPGDDPDDQPPPGSQRGGPVFNTFPPQISNPPQTGVSVMPGGVTPYQNPLQLPADGSQQAPTGASTPGVIVAPPPPQQQPGQPVIPGQPRRPGGGG